MVTVGIAVGCGTAVTVFVSMTVLQCAMAVVIVIGGGLHPGPFRAGFSEMCWGMTYTPHLEIKARHALNQERR